MIIWQGFGILIPIVALAVMLTVQLGFEAVIPSEIMKDYSSWFSLANFIAIAAALHGLAILFGKIGRPRVVIDKETGNEIILKRTDSLFFVPARFWPFVVLAMGALVLLGFLN
jgi:hypothetical protein